MLVFTSASLRASVRFLGVHHFLCLSPGGAGDAVPLPFCGSLGPPIPFPVALDDPVVVGVGSVRVLR